MSSNRRDFVLASAAAAVWGHCSAASAQESAAPLVDGFPVLDYGRSFVFGSAPFNNVRFWVESRTILLDGDQKYECLQFGACKSENTFAEKDLFTADNYDFTPLLGDDEQWLIFRRKNRITPEYRQVKSEVWGPSVRKLRLAKNTRVLTNFAEIRDATADAHPLVSRTELLDPATGLRAIIEAPVKTINIQPEKQQYQIDSGPVALPDLSRRYETRLDCLRLAFVAFNAPHFADFVVEQPDSVMENGQELYQVFHYSKPISLEAKNTLIAVLD